MWLGRHDPTTVAMVVNLHGHHGGGHTGTSMVELHGSGGPWRPNLHGGHHGHLHGCGKPWWRSNLFCLPFFFLIFNFHFIVGDTIVISHALCYQFDGKWDESHALQKLNNSRQLKKKVSKSIKAQDGYMTFPKKEIIISINYSIYKKQGCKILFQVVGSTNEL